MFSESSVFKSKIYVNRVLAFLSIFICLPFLFQNYIRIVIQEIERFCIDIRLLFQYRVSCSMRRLPFTFNGIIILILRIRSPWANSKMAIFQIKFMTLKRMTIYRLHVCRVPLNCILSIFHELLWWAKWFFSPLNFQN